MTEKEFLKKKNLVTVKTLADELGISLGYCRNLVQWLRMKPNGRLFSGRQGPPSFTYSRAEANRFVREFKRRREQHQPF